MFDFSNYSAKSKYYDDSYTLFIGKRKDETAGAGIYKFVGFKPKIYSFLVDDRSEHKTEMQNVAAIISHNEFVYIMF